MNILILIVDIFIFFMNRALIELQDEPTKQTQSTVSNSYESPDDKIVHGMISGDVSVDRIKSAISVVQEIAQKRDLPIRFVVENETGPAHMKHFIIKCSVGDIEVSIEVYYRSVNIFLSVFNTLFYFSIPIDNR